VRLGNIAVFCLADSLVLVDFASCLANAVDFTYVFEVDLILT